MSKIEHCVYLLKDTSRPHHYKIGVSNDIINRCNYLKSQTIVDARPIAFKKMVSREAAFCLESKLHKKYNLHFTGYSEMYVLSILEIEDILEYFHMNDDLNVYFSELDEINGMDNESILLKEGIKELIEKHMPCEKIDYIRSSDSCEIHMKCKSIIKVKKFLKYVDVIIKGHEICLELEDSPLKIKRLNKIINQYTAKKFIVNKLLSVNN